MQWWCVGHSAAPRRWRAVQRGRCCAVSANPCVAKRWRGARTAAPPRLGAAVIADAGFNSSFCRQINLACSDTLAVQSSRDQVVLGGYLLAVASCEAHTRLVYSHSQLQLSAASSLRNDAALRSNRSAALRAKNLNARNTDRCAANRRKDVARRRHLGQQRRR